MQFIDQSGEPGPAAYGSRIRPGFFVLNSCYIRVVESSIVQIDKADSNHRSHKIEQMEDRFLIFLFYL
ncbi:hypothetical protein E4413_04435 [Leptospira interrogans]|uniref:Uncharacterized protein n=1 Tax=Leptospira interrogans serovar Bataviae TaxID=312175 RepID=A0AAP9WHH6_LEPIR|nr:hypothetical protein C4X99_14735 [Leptospira interrogans serovar Geyaweera]OOB96176.1 hypothetical protein B0191_05270 [Leptospira interrogans serovar Hardjo]QCO40260.1 hypothetical protein E4413_04435 [Leptospira interrogans]QEI00894.1 hypothetical protein FWJ33_16795 [Leptospira interrogans serovar Hardjo]QOI49873.1 hypothetical protein Lepto1489_04950 [Leptospira interrogans serovar Bataviae]